MDFNSYLSEHLSILLDIAPHGTFCGCGETTEYLSYILQNKPIGEKNIFEALRTHLYYDSAKNIRQFTINQLHEILTEIDNRLDQFNYVTISFYNEIENSNENITNKEIMAGIKDLIFNTKNVKPKLYDHSFVLAKLNNNYIRLESYIFNYKPRQIIWNNYKEDLIKLLSTNETIEIKDFIYLGDIVEVWKNIFNVECDQISSLDKIKIVINN